MLKDSTRKYLCRVEGLYDQKQHMSFATVPLIPENVYVHLREMDWQLVAIYFTVKSPAIFRSARIRSFSSAQPQVDHACG